MNETPGRRFAALSGIGLAAALAVWWLGSARLAIEHGADAARGSADALRVAWLLRALLVPVLGVRIAALFGWRAGTVSSLAIVAPSWPVVAMAWAASAVSPVQLVLAEAFLLVEALVSPLVGRTLRRIVPRPEIAEPLASAIGVALAAALWLCHDRLSLPSGL